MRNLTAINFRISSLILLINLLIFHDIIFSQNDKPDAGKDTVASISAYNQKMNGIFVTPFIGIDWPVRDFHNISKSTVAYGIKLEFASFKLYPLVLGIMYKYQNNHGNDDFITAQYLNTFDTKLMSYGVTADIILNKFLHLNFSLPFIFLEAKYISVQRVISPPENPLNYSESDNLFGFTLGGGFTLSIFDIYGGYTFAKDYSSAGINTRIHFALIKF
jgi:hypothetical protein